MITEGANVIEYSPQRGTVPSGGQFNNHLASTQLKPNQLAHFLVCTSIESAHYMSIDSYIQYVHF